MDQIEVELKYAITEEIWEKLSLYLRENFNSIIIKTKEELDTYFESLRGEKFADQDKALRLRQSFELNKQNEITNKRIEITFKGKKISKKSKTRREINIQIGNYELFVDLLKELNFNSVKQVRKKRKVYQLKIPDLSTKISICYDIVDKVGHFIELEGFSDNVNNVSTMEDKMINFWKNLLTANNIEGKKYKESIRKSYLELLAISEKEESNNLI